VAEALKREREAQQAAMEKMIAAALEKQRAMLEAQGLKVQMAAAPKPAAPDPREAELKAAAAKAAADRAAAEKALAEAKAAADRAAAEKLAAQKAVADLAAAERAATERAAAAKAASDKLPAEQTAAKLAAERAEAERIAAQKTAAELNATADRVTAERVAAEKERIQVAAAAPVSISAGAGSGRLPQPGDTWTYRLTEPDRRDGPKQREYRVRIVAASATAVLDEYSVEGGEWQRWAHTPDRYLAGLGVSLFSPYLEALTEVLPGTRLGGVAIADLACGGAYLCHADAKVLARETVTLHAGKFEAIKVEVEHIWRPKSASGGGFSAMSGGRYLTVWYVPVLKRAVKFSSRSVAGTSPPVEPNFTLELVSYKLN
jgi:hypothetical protein